MYFLFGILFLLCALFWLIFFWRRRKIIHRIRCMHFCQKLHLLNEQLLPFGFAYLPSQDIITSTRDAWQREFGYRALFDKTAPFFHMIFDCEPVCFDYDGRTWLIEFWKGQYGINIGGEIGVYYADAIVPREQLADTHFACVSDEHLLPFSMELYRQNQLLFSASRLHWWLTGFCMGTFCSPEELSMHASVTFPDDRMQRAFVNALQELGYKRSQYDVCGTSVSLKFAVPHSRQPRFALFAYPAYVQLKNRLLCFLYQKITRPFTATPDKLLYLYYLLPSAFRRTLTFQKYKKKSRLYKKESCKAGFSACGGSQSDTFQSAAVRSPRSVLSYRERSFLYDKKQRFRADRR